MDLNLNNLSPYIRVALEGWLNPSYFLERTIFDYELLYVKEGELEVTVEDTVYHGIPGDLFLFKPGQKHSLRVEGQATVSQPHVHFDLFYQTDSPEVKVCFNPMEKLTEQEKSWIREDATPLFPIHLPNHIRLPNAIYVEKILYEIIQEFRMKLPFYESTSKGLFIQLWTTLLREHHWSSNHKVFSHWEELNLVKTYLTHHLDREISLHTLANMAALSKFHLIRLFKLTFGMTPIKYHIITRIEKSKELIQFTDIPLTQIAEKFGFQSIHSFSRAFKNVEGVAPSFYRARS